MSVAEILIISIGLSLDVFVAVTYISVGFSKISVRNVLGLSLVFGGVQLGCLLVGNLVTLCPILPGAHRQDVADGWEGITVLIFAGLGIYMICKGIKREMVLERRKDEIDWRTTTVLAFLTSIDAFLAGMGLGFLDIGMIAQSITLFPVTIIMVILGVFVGYRLGLKHTRHAYWVGGALLLMASIDVMIYYYI